MMRGVEFLMVVAVDMAVGGVIYYWRRRRV